MEHLTFTIEDVPSARLLSARTVAPQSDLGEAIGRLITTLYGAVGGRASGPPVCVYPEPYDPDRVVAEPGLPYDGDPPYGFDIRELPACRAVVGRLDGSYEQLPDAWRATMDHLQRQGLEVAGAPYERYVAEGTTEIIVPLS